MYMNYESIWNSWKDAGNFSGVFSVRGKQGTIFEKCCTLVSTAMMAARTRCILL